MARPIRKYSQKVADSAREQTLLTLIDLLVEQNRDYRDIFTSNETFINRALAPVYKVPYLSRQEWAKYTFPDDAERSGILTQITFLSLFSHPAASSPTKRGVKVNEIFMCSPTPEPPADVDFSKVQALDKGTVRTRLLAHKENAGCAVCHRVSDPPGLALEHFDGIGQLRKLENGQPIDVSAEIDGDEVQRRQRPRPDAARRQARTACLVRNVYAYGIGRPTSDKDEDYLDRRDQGVRRRRLSLQRSADQHRDEPWLLQGRSACRPRSDKLGPAQVASKDGACKTANRRSRTSIALEMTK